MDFHFIFDYFQSIFFLVLKMNIQHKINLLMCVFYFRFLSFSKKSTYAKMINIDPGSLLIIGSFKKQSVDPDFKVKLSTFSFTFYQSKCFGGKSEWNCCTRNMYWNWKNANKFVDYLKRKKKSVRFRQTLSLWFSFGLICFLCASFYTWNHKNKLIANKSNASMVFVRYDKKIASFFCNHFKSKLFSFVK